MKRERWTLPAELIDGAAVAATVRAEVARDAAALATRGIIPGLTVVLVGDDGASAVYVKAKEMVAKGMIGEVHYVRAFWYRNSLEDNPAWRYAIPADATEKNTDWKRFLGSAKNRPFDKQRYYQWRLYWDYSGGISTDLFVHLITSIHFIMDATMPDSVFAGGGKTGSS